MNITVRSTSTTVVTVMAEPRASVKVNMIPPTVRVLSNPTQSIFVVLDEKAKVPVRSVWLPTEVSFIHTITEKEVTDKKLTLSAIPVSNFTFHHITGGIPLVINRDFVLSGDTVSWEGMGLDGTMNVNDEIFIKYFI